MSVAAPPAARSRKGMHFSAAAAEGRLRLQRCAACSHLCYPAREGCPKCWSPDLRWVDVPGGGTLLAESTVRASFSPYFQQRGPWRIGTVQLDAGPVVLAHLHQGVRDRGRVRMIARTDASGQGVLMALPQEESPNMMDDPQLKTLSCDPQGRAVLVTDGRSAAGRAVASALAAAGASPLWIGMGAAGEACDAGAELESVPAARLVPLDVADDQSVHEAAAAIAGGIDILVNTAGIDRAGSALDGGDIAAAREEMEVNCLGLLRLIRAFAPALRDRGAHADGRLGAFVNVLPVQALCNWPPFGTSAASQAAARALIEGLRIELAGSGIKVIEVLHGPLDDASHATVPPPKVAAAQLAGAIVAAMRQGIEIAAVGPVAEDIFERFRENPLAVQRERM